MYNSTNLPLSPRKVVKKTLPTIFSASVLFFFLGVIMVIFNKAMGSDLGNSAVSDLSRYLPFILPIFWIVICAISIGYEYFYYKLYFYNFEEDKAEIKKGVVAQATGIVRYGKIQNLYVDQDILDRIFGLYDVHYETAGETSTFYSHVDGLNMENSGKLVSFLKERIGDNSVEKMKDAIATPIAEPVQFDDSLVMFSRDNIALSNKYLLGKAFTNAGILIVGLFFISTQIVEILNDIPDFKINWIYVSLLVLLAFLAMMVSSWLWLKFFDFEFKNSSLQIKKGIISKSSSYIYYNRIQNINVNQGFFDRILGTFYLGIETAGEGNVFSKFQIPALEKEDAKKLKDFLMEKTNKHRAV